MFRKQDDLPAPEIPGAEEVAERVTEEEPTVVKRGRRGSKKAKKSSSSSTRTATEASTAPAPKARAIQFINAGRRIVRDCPSGASYIWEAPGAVVNVAAEDVDRVMGANRSGTRECCGGSSEQIYFVFAD